MRDWLKTLRKKKGLTMKQLSGKLGISEGYYCSIERGEKKKTLDLNLAQGLSKALGVSLRKIAEMDGEEQG